MYFRAQLVKNLIGSLIFVGSEIDFRKRGCTELCIGYHLASSSRFVKRAHWTHLDTSAVVRSAQLSVYLPAASHFNFAALTNIVEPNI